jgi:metal-responsive CopG/Arc/MetJ family transcriptional regulator
LKKGREIELMKWRDFDADPRNRRGQGYTKGMKTAISIPDDVFEGAERLARRTKKSRSQLFSDAIKEYIARHAPDEVTEAMDQVCAEVGNATDEFAASAARRVLERSEW